MKGYSIIPLLSFVLLLPPLFAGTSPFAKAVQKKKTKSIIVITQDNLKKFSLQGARRLTVTQKGSEGITYVPTKLKDTKGRGEDYWREEKARLVQDLQEAQKKLKELQALEAKLQTQYYNWDDPAYRDGVIKPQWDQALKDIEKAKEKIKAAQKALQALEERARKAGVPPGWLR